jgi:hypothetical protein
MWNLQNVVCVLISTGRGIFIGVQGWVTDLVKSVTHQVVASRPCGSASTDFLHRLGLPLLVWTRVHEATSQTDIKHGQQARGFGWQATPWAH